MIVVMFIPIIGQIEGHVHQPLIMSRSVQLHTAVADFPVVCGGLFGGVWKRYSRYPSWLSSGR